MLNWTTHVPTNNSSHQNDNNKAAATARTTTKETIIINLDLWLDTFNTTTAYPKNNITRISSIKSKWIKCKTLQSFYSLSRAVTGSSRADLSQHKKSDCYTKCIKQTSSRLKSSNQRDFSIEHRWNISNTDSRIRRKTIPQISVRI